MGTEDDVYSLFSLDRKNPDSQPEMTARVEMVSQQSESASPAPEPPQERPSTSPPSHRSRILGAVLGAAIGDAMGHPTEFLSLEMIRDRYGPQGVTTFELYCDRGGQRFAPYTDDTQMAECVLRALLAEHEDLDRAMNQMAELFVEWSRNPQGGHRAPGNACLAGCRALAGGAHWSTAGGPTAGGCGSVMRAYPFGLFFANDLKKAEEWAVAHSKLTHRDPIALAASAAMAVGIAHAMNGEGAVYTVTEMLAASARYSTKTGIIIAEAIDNAQSGEEPDDVLDRLQGWAAHEAIAAAIYVFLRHPDDPRAAILEGANTPGDSDSIATLAGALTGCRNGIETVPKEWVADVERSGELAGLAEQIP